MNKTVIIKEVQLQRIRNLIKEEKLGTEAVYGEYMRYIEEIGEHGTLQPVPFTQDDDLWYLIGACTFFDGYTSEGELNEDEFCEFLDYFFEKYGEGVLANNVTTDDVYDTFLPSDMETGLTQYGFSVYKAEVSERGKESFEWFQQFLKFNDNGQIYCARAVQVSDEMRAEDFLEDYGRNIGIYWSFADSGARTYYSNVYGPVVVFKGWVNPCDVNWGETIQTQSADEEEIRLNDGATVQVDQIVTDYGEKNLLTTGSILLHA